MKKYLAVLTAFFTLNAQAEDKFLSYQFNENVVITISSIACPVKKIAKEFQFAVMATRKDGEHLPGCFTHEGDNIVIQWLGGDKTVLPANVFLMKPDT
jgi:hypothetical protein